MAGAIALVARGARFLLGAGLAAAEVVASDGMAEAAARQGDLTGFAERRAARQAAVRRRRLMLAMAALCGAVLFAAPGLGRAREVYAVAALLWLVPPTRIRPQVFGSSLP